MKVVGNIPSAPMNFPALMKSLSSSLERTRLLKTSQQTGFLSEGVLLSRMNSEELAQVSRAHWDALATEKDYAETAPFDLRGILPAWAGPEAISCRYAGVGAERKLALVTGGGLGVLVETAPLATLLSRHPGAVWHFGCSRPGGPGYWRFPLVLLEGNGFAKGELLGALAPVAVRPGKFPFRVPPGECLRLGRNGRSFCYRPEKIGQEALS